MPSVPWMNNLVLAEVIQRSVQRKRRAETGPRVIVKKSAWRLSTTTRKIVDATSSKGVECGSSVTVKATVILYAGRDFVIRSIDIPG
jgi:hypothetical protein